MSTLAPGSQRPKVAVAVIVFRDGKILCGKRKGDGHSDGMYGVPGGHIEFGERIVEAATREIAEETGITVSNVSFAGIVNVREFLPAAHYIMIMLRADWVSGEPMVLEADRCDGWGWYATDALLTPLTPGTEKGIRALLEGKSMFD